MRPVKNNGYDIFPIISIEEGEIRALAKKHYGTELTEQECESLFHMFNVDFSKVDDDDWEGAVAHMVQAIITAIGTVKGSHGYARNE